mmetsp:Transcript_93890/g.287285  ORF Transcript_93890/g.287285 Transcript_93890/m.287285 type:complete len:557 (-) Transcript_93890:164-1834(-)
MSIRTSSRRGRLLRCGLRFGVLRFGGLLLCWGLNFGGLVFLLRADAQHGCRLLAHDVAVHHGVPCFLRGDVLPRLVRLASREALGDADARAIELADDPFLLRHRHRRPALTAGGVDHVGGPPQGNRLVREIQGLHQHRAILLCEFLAQGRKIDADRFLFMRSLLDLLLSFVGGATVIVAICGLLLLDVGCELTHAKLLIGDDTIVVIEILGAGAADGGHTAGSGHLVDDAEANRVHHVESQLAFKDAAGKALIRQLTASCLTALEVLPRALARPLPGSLTFVSAVDAPSNELRDGVLFNMVVVRLHQNQLIAVFDTGIPELLAIVTLLQVDDPDAFAGRAAVLLDHARLELHRLFEPGDELLIRVIGSGVRHANVQILDLGQCIFGTHEFHHVWGRPHGLPLCLQRPHGIVEFLLVTTVLLDLTRVATHEDRVHLLHNGEEHVVLAVDIMDGVARQARMDHAIAKNHGVVPMAVATFVRAADLVGIDVDLYHARLLLGKLWLRKEAIVVRSDLDQASFHEEMGLVHFALLIFGLFESPSHRVVESLAEQRLHCIKV